MYASGLDALIDRLLFAEVEFVVVGGAAAVLHGAPIVTNDLDLVHRRTPENVERLLAVLRSVDAKLRTDARGLRPEASWFLGSGHVLLATTEGPLDLLCELGPGQDHGWLTTRCVSVPRGNREVRVIDLATLIEVKAATGRIKDRMVLPVLLATLEERSRPR